MEIPSYQPFYLPTAEALREEIARLGLSIPLDDDFSRLAQPLEIAGRLVPNRFCAQPIAGHDANPDGSPGALTRRRYRRLAEGGFGLIWLEATAAGAPEKAGQLALNGSTWPDFRALVQELRAASPAPPVLILQITGNQAAPFVETAALAHEAGFDGVDLQAPRDLLAPALATIRQTTPSLLRAVRLNVYEAVRGGFGVSASDYRKADPAEPIRLLTELRAAGLDLLNVTASSPMLTGPQRGTRAHADSENPGEHPLMVLQRQLALSRALREAAPGLPVVGSGFSWLRQFVPHVAAGALREGMLDFAGLGRGALAYPNAPADLLARGEIDAGSACMVCFACSQLREEAANVGCVIRDSAIYGEPYRQMRRFDPDQLLAGAARCHLCEAAPCVRASPTQTDIPAFIQAFRSGDERRAYEIIRARDALPELTSRLAPGWLESEGACIETALTGTPVPILDLQYAIAWRARDRGETGVRVPAANSGKRVAIVGGGPAGLSAALRLVEHGHTVHLFEQSDRLGGAPERVIPLTRHPSAHAEIDAALQPALAAGRLRVQLGARVEIAALLAEHDAVLLATGLWQERSLGATRGVVGALTFLENQNNSVPARVALLAGSDAAMDAARELQRRGAREIFVIFGGPRSALHWHMAESWFATPGVHAMMNREPLGYDLDPAGQIRGVRLRDTLLDTESVLPVQLVVEAMELQVADSIRAALAAAPGRLHTAGALVNGGASVGRCVAEGRVAADAIHQEISP